MFSCLWYVIFLNQTSGSHFIHLVLLEILLEMMNVITCYVVRNASMLLLVIIHPFLTMTVR
jgi:hypothetical protein